MEQKEKKRKKKKNFRGGYYDYNLLAIVILLICFGLIMLYSTSAYEAQMKFHGDDMYYFRRQALISVGAIVIGNFDIKIGLSSDDSVYGSVVRDLAYTDGNGTFFSVWCGSIRFQTMVKTGNPVPAVRDCQDCNHYFFTGSHY